MSTMFRDFSFDAPSRRPSSQHAADSSASSVSPTSMLPLPYPLPARLPTPPPCSIGELTEALGQHDLRIVVDSSFKAANEPLTPPSDDVAFPNELLPRSPPLSTERLNSATLRMQRQANVRMQCSSEHRKDISSLVKKMIDVGDQCRLCIPKSRTPTPPPASEYDEGVDMDYTPSDSKAEMRFMLSVCRSGERPDGCARVTKSVRMRKKSRTLKKLSR